MIEIRLKAKYRSAQHSKQKGGHNDGLRGQKRVKIGRAAHEKRFGPQRERVLVIEGNKRHFEDVT